MKYIQRLRSSLCTGLLALSLLAVLSGSVTAEDPDSDSTADSVVSSVTENIFQRPAVLADKGDQQNTDTSTHRYSEQELNDMFNGMPLLLDGGSFTLNQFNGFPDTIMPLHQGIVTIDGQKYRFRGSWQDLEHRLTARLNSYQGDWGAYIKDLSTGQVIEINEHPMQAASLIKLYIAGATYEQIELGNLAVTDTISNALSQMITVSSNEASNTLVWALCDETERFQTGMDTVNDFNDRFGFTNTTQYNGLSDPSLWLHEGHLNETSPADCGHILEMIYNGDLVSHFASFRFEVLLNKQEVNYKIPAGLPEGTHISHKTGEVADTENDAAIIYTPYGDYIFCIMSTDLYDTNAAVDHIRSITRDVHRYFTTPTLTPVEES